MENKINIAEILKNCPSGMELDCTMWDNVEFDHIDMTKSYPIYIRIKEDVYEQLTQYGQWNNNPNAKCVIFPKGKTTWEGFQRPFKDGDIIFTHANCLKVGLGNTWISIYQENRNGGVATYVDYAEDGSDYYSNIDGDKALLCMENDILRQRLATEEEKQKLFDAIKANGYKWNSKTKTLEELIEPKFKVGDIIKYIYFDRKVAKVIKIHDNRYELDNGKFIEFQEENAYEISYDKFDITTLKPFDKVLVRTFYEEWKADFFSHYSKEADFPYSTVGKRDYYYCIPYEGNEHLCGTTNDCDEYYKNWE